MISNDPPQAVGDGDETLEVCTDQVPAVIDVLDNDLDPDGDEFAISGVQNTTDEGGTAQAVAFNEVSYSPPVAPGARSSTTASSPAPHCKAHSQPGSRSVASPTLRPRRSTRKYLR